MDNQVDNCNDDVKICEHEIAALRQDLNNALRHLHFMGMQTKHDVIDALSRLFALIEELVAAGRLDLRSFEERRNRLWASEEARFLKQTHVQIENTVDKYRAADLPEIDCASRIELCKARCCTFSIPLSFQDLDEGALKWNYAAPYLMRQEKDGYCTYLDRSSHACTVYDKRPAVCRTYDCRYDKRIWNDFAKRIIAAGG